MWLHGIAVIIATVCCFVQIRSIVISGVALSVTGLLLVWSARRCGNAPGVLLGLSGPVISIGSLIVINLWDWNPNEAESPMRIVAVLYSLFTVLLMTQIVRVVEQRQSDLPADHPS